jgi:hypothetical protein
VADFYPAGCRFESCWDRQPLKPPLPTCPLFTGISDLLLATLRLATGRSRFDLRGGNLGHAAERLFVLFDLFHFRFAPACSISPVAMRARGSDGRRPRKSPLHRLDPVHVGCKKLAPALASMDDKRMLHPFRALAPDLK